MWDYQGKPLYQTPELWERDALPFSAIPGLGATEVEGEGARQLRSPFWALRWACPLGKQALFFAGAEAVLLTQTGMLQFFPKP